MLSYSTVWHLLHVVYNILNMQRSATSVAGQTCSYSDKAAKGGSQYLCFNENVSLLRHSYAILSHWHGIISMTDIQGCQFGFFEAKFVIFGFFSTPSAYFYFWKKTKLNLAFLGFFGEFDLHVWRWFWQTSGHWQISRHCFWTQNDKFWLETLQENL